MTYLGIIENNYSRTRVEPFHDNILSRMSVYEISTILYDFFLLKPPIKSVKKKINQ